MWNLYIAISKWWNMYMCKRYSCGVWAKIICIVPWALSSVLNWPPKPIQFDSVIVSLFGYHYLVLYQDVLSIEAILFQYLFLYYGFDKICDSLDRWRGTECLNYIHSHFLGRFLDILGYLNNAHKNPKFGRVRQVPIWELGWEFPGWDLSHFAKFGIFMGIL